MFTSGMTLGIIVMPLLTQWLLDLYGWRGTILLLGGISLNAIVCGSLMRPNSSDYQQIKSQLKSSTQNKGDIKLSSHLFENFRKYVDMDLLSNTFFLKLMSLYAGNGFVTTGWLIYVVPHVSDIGFTLYEASIVALTGGIANLTGNLMYPILLKFARNKTLLYVSVIFLSFSFALDVLASRNCSYMGLIGCSLAFGLGRGLLQTVLLAVAKDNINEYQMVNAMSLFYGVYGLASVFSGFSCGKFASLVLCHNFSGFQFCSVYDYGVTT